MSIEDLGNTQLVFEPGSLNQNPPTVDVPPLNLWENMEADATYWNGMLDTEETYEDNIEPTQLRNEGTVGQPLAPNRRVSAPPPAAFIVIDDDDDDSYTGSSYELKDMEINGAIPPTVPIGPNSLVETNGTGTLLSGSIYLTIVNNICIILTESNAIHFE